MSVVIPAHNEAAVIGRLLSALVSGESEVVVVANGCTDDTAAIAAGFTGVTVVETPVGNKHRALRLGDEHAHAYPRLYVDGDVVLSAAGARALAYALREPGILAAAPARRLELSGRPLVVRWYYHVWELLPGVRQALYGRGVIGVTAEGHKRIAALPELMGDDLAASVAFASDERVIVDTAEVVVHTPRTTADLLRRRVRSLTSTAQLHGSMPEATDGARTSMGDLARLMLGRPWLLPKMAVFLGVTVIARMRARKPIRSGDYQTWLRDESSRAS
ncbi:glycosyltransferase family 2 protein [Allorhizocola rhizosphaerae]|uniref:glycosyltransferase family 2 protein n=1 Tax=Allorhizocola rhizosphaerae TaxID=1872709 RepID=UPI000E3DB31E|nr:glycosyltransferase [Allorhizocola rhizosphaerae]